MKKIATFLCSVLLSASFLSSCGMTTDSIEIESVKAVLNEETGVTTVTIRYLDDIEDPLIFEIPAGQQGLTGLQGNGIEKIEPVLNDQNERTGLKIYFTDAEMEPLVVPLTDGKNGLSIKDVESEMQEDGSIKLTFKDDNGKPVGASVTVPSGTKITDIISTPLADGSIEVEVYYSNNVDPHKFKIDAARGVSDISTEMVNNQYVITFSYTDGTTSTVSFDRPNAWLSGVGAPNPVNGIVGDFYFDTVNKIIYQKEEKGWSLIANLNPDEMIYTISFVVGSDVIWPIGAKKEYTLNAGESFASRNYNVPLPHHVDGYTFLGWYTVDEQTTITVNHSRFTDLTPVSGNLTLYAHWERI